MVSNFGWWRKRLNPLDGAQHEAQQRDIVGRGPGFSATQSRTLLDDF
jgi:hypothetical protein